jgi:hypothetical protein
MLGRFDCCLVHQHSFSRCQQLAAIKRTIPNLISNRPVASLTSHAQRSLENVYFAPHPSSLET